MRVVRDFGGTVEKSAVISPCGRFRYRLTRRWAPGPLLPFIMLNPSTADAEVDDPTIRRCMGFARREGFAGIRVANLFAFRATRPRDLYDAGFPFGPLNDEELIDLMLEALRDDVPVICAWGATWKPIDGDISGYGRARTMCLGKTKEGDPRHPLYVPAYQPLEPYP